MSAQALDRFKREANGVLVATDVAARGLDVAGIRCVVRPNADDLCSVLAFRLASSFRVDSLPLAFTGGVYWPVPAPWLGGLTVGMSLLLANLNRLWTCLACLLCSSVKTCSPGSGSDGRLLSRTCALFDRCTTSCRRRRTFMCIAAAAQRAPRQTA